MTLTLILRFLRRDFFASTIKELRLVLIALVVAVAAVTSVGFLTSRVGEALERESHQMLGADLLLISDHPWPSSLENEIEERGLRLARTQTFPSMIAVAGRPQMVGVKAVSDEYPLRGKLRIAQAAHSADRETDGVPAPGEAWIETRLAVERGIRVGDELTLGKTRLKVAAILTYEPDAGLNFFNIAPRLLMNEADLAATELVQVGSRVVYRLLVAGDASRVEALRRWLDSRLQRGERIEDAKNARPEIQSALDRADRFLGLASLLTVILAAVAVALASRRYLQRHLDVCAVMRCLGATQHRLLRLYLTQFALLGAIAATIGCLLGYIAHFVLYRWLAALIGVELPPPSAVPLAQGACVGFLLLFGFAAPPLFQLRRVAPLRLLRRETGAPEPAFLGGYTLGLVALVALLIWVAGDVKLGAYAAAGFIVGFMAFILAGRVLVALAGWLPRSGSFGWRHGIAGLARRPWSASLQVGALALGFMAILLLTVTRGELLEAWRQATPPDAPNRFVINIQPEQRDALDDFFKSAAIEAELSPMIRGRLTAINERPVSAADYPEERAQRLVEREFNLSTRSTLPPGNITSAGRWFSAEGGRTGECSVEEGLAETLGIKLGDRLRFSIAGETVEMTVVGLRKLQWDSMRVNFFVLTPPGLIDDFPRSLITSFYLPPGKEDFVASLVKNFPNLTIIDVSTIITQLERIMEQVARAVQFIFLFTLLAGFIVLDTTLLATFDERRYELAVMRALGARGKQLTGSLLAEFAAIGALAGLVAALGAMLCGFVIGRQVFGLDMSYNLYLPFFCLAIGAFIVAVGCLPGIVRLLRTSPLLTLRAAE